MVTAAKRRATKEPEAIPAPDPILDAEAKAAVDAAIARNLGIAQSNGPSKMKVVTLYQEAVAIVFSGMKEQKYKPEKPFVSEANGVKLFELVLMYALNNRDRFYVDFLGEGEETGEPTGFPFPDEILGGDAAVTESDSDAE